MKHPNYYLPIMPYLVLERARDFIPFLEMVFKAKVEMNFPREDGSIMHAEVRIGNAVVMFTEANDDNMPFPGGMFLVTKDVDGVHQSALASGAVSMMEPSDQDYGRAAGFKDPFGNVWWLAMELPEQPEA
jgi:PhnB protein